MEIVYTKKFARQATTRECSALLKLCVRMTDVRGLQSMDYIRFYHLRAYDRINAPYSA